MRLCSESQNFYHCALDDSDTVVAYRVLRELPERIGKLGSSQRGGPEGAQDDYPDVWVPLLASIV